MLKWRATRENFTGKGAEVTTNIQNTTRVVTWSA